MATPSSNNNYNANYTGVYPIPTGTTSAINTTTTWAPTASTTTTWGTSYGVGDIPKVKEWTKIKCHGCGKELGFVKDSYDWKVDSYYCEDCKLLEKLKE